MCSSSAPRAPAQTEARQPRVLLSRRQFDDLMINPARPGVSSTSQAGPTGGYGDGGSAGLSTGGMSGTGGWDIGGGPTAATLRVAR